MKYHEVHAYIAGVMCCSNCVFMVFCNAYLYNIPLKVYIASVPLVSEWDPYKTSPDNGWSLNRNYYYCCFMAYHVLKRVKRRIDRRKMKLLEKYIIFTITSNSSFALRRILRHSTMSSMTIIFEQKITNSIMPSNRVRANKIIIYYY